MKEVFMKEIYRVNVNFGKDIIITAIITYQIDDILKKDRGKNARNRQVRVQYLMNLEEAKEVCYDRSGDQVWLVGAPWGRPLFCSGCHKKGVPDPSCLRRGVAHRVVGSIPTPLSKPRWGEGDERISFHR